MKEIPSEVFLMNATSSGEAPISLANRPRAASPSSCHFRSWNAPSSRDRKRWRAPASAAREGMGDTPAWFRYTNFSVTGNSVFRMGSTSIGTGPPRAFGAYPLRQGTPEGFRV
jgi:hypothetical protein